MKVFISWSGAVSHKVAVSLRDWLPSVIQTISPYVSSEDIDKGARWSSDIASELDESAFGILCVTKENINAPWLNFEAGALGKSIDKSKVCPFLFQIKRSEVEGPILQYQSTIYEKDDAFKLLKSINEACGKGGISDQQLVSAFDVWWPQLQSSLDVIKDVPLQESESSERSTASPDEYVSSILEELLELSRTNQKLLRDPESILPQDYFEHLYGKYGVGPDHHRDNKVLVDLDAFEEIIKRHKALIRLVKSRKDIDMAPSEYHDEMLEHIRRVDDPLRYITKRLGKHLPRDLYEDYDNEL